MQLPLLIRATLYRLKRLYGGPIDIYKCVSSDTDMLTGARTLNVQVTHVQRAVCLPATQKRREAVSPKKTGLYDVSVESFIVECKDAFDLTGLTGDDWIVAKNKRYQVSQVENYGDVGWLVTGRELVGTVPHQIRELKAETVVSVATHG